MSATIDDIITRNESAIAQMEKAATVVLERANSDRLATVKLAFVEGFLLQLARRLDEQATHTSYPWSGAREAADDCRAVVAMIGISDIAMNRPEIKLEKKP